MKEIINNKENLQEDQVDIKKEKARALIVDSNDKIIVCEYCGAFLLPGGKVEKGESPIKGLKRELKEELGLEFSDKEIIPFLKMIDYQKNYITRKGNRKNRKITTNFFVINSDLKIDLNNINPTAEEFGNLRYHRINYHDVYKLLSLPTKNPRREYFDRELYRATLEYANAKNIDLHTHTSLSDGELNKAELIKKAKKNRISTLSICDHDGIEAFKEEGFVCENDFMLIPGVEITCKTNKGQLHVLGYDYDIDNKELNDFLALVRKNHIDNMQLVNKSLFDHFEIKIDDEKIQEFIQNDQIGRVYLAKELIRLGYANSVKDAFNKYLIASQNQVKTSLKEVTWQEAFRNIKLAGGLVVLAHPVSLKRTPEELEELVSEMKENGLDGIETYNQIYTNDDINLFQALAQKYDLYQTIGSDFHGMNIKPSVKLANGSIMSKKIKKLNFVEEIKKRHNIK